MTRKDYERAGELLELIENEQGQVEDITRFLEDGFDDARLQVDNYQIYLDYHVAKKVLEAQLKAANEKIRKANEELEKL